MISAAIRWMPPMSRVPTSIRITAATMILSAIGSRKMPSLETVPRARHIAVEIICHAHQAVEDERDGVAERPLRPPQEGDQQRHREDARQREQVEIGRAHV